MKALIGDFNLSVIVKRRTSKSFVSPSIIYTGYTGYKHRCGHWRQEGVVLDYVQLLPDASPATGNLEQTDSSIFVLNKQNFPKLHLYWHFNSKAEHFVSMETFKLIVIKY